MLNKIGTQEIETERLLLRRMNISDSEDMFNNWASDPCVSKFYSWEPHKNIYETEDIIKTWVAQYNDPLYFHWIVTDKGTNEAIGTFYINHIDEENCTGTINCILAKQVWGKGLYAIIAIILGVFINLIIISRIYKYKWYKGFPATVGPLGLCVILVVIISIVSK